MSSDLLSMLGEASLRAAVLALLVGGILAALRIGHGALRHAAWTAVLVAMLLMPLLPAVAPAIEIPMSSPAMFDDIERNFDSEPAPPNAEMDAVAPAKPGPAAMVAQSRQSTFSWQDGATAIYAAGILALSLQWCLGWRGVQRLMRRARPVELATRHHVLESADLAAPVTVGLVRPTILLPSAWRDWPDETLRAVLAHEAAHISRRDPVAALLGRFNRCVFWFHPLAWWLERTLAAEAEHACDDAAAQALSERHRYAAVLLDMAKAVHDRRGRLAMHMLGGHLRRRIDHLLTVPIAGPSRRLKVVLACSCAGAILVAVACRPRSASDVGGNAAIEQRDRLLQSQLRAILTADQRNFMRIEWDLDPGRVKQLEGMVAANGDDETALRELLIVYWARRDAESRRPHILRLYERHPESALAGSVEARLFPSTLEGMFPADTAGYAHAKALWLELVQHDDAAPAVLGNAAAFFESAEPARAEKLLLRARDSDPGGPWTVRLARLYVTVLTGSEAPAGRNRLVTLSPPDSRGAFGTLVRRTLGESNDEILLTAAGWFLARSPRRWRMDFEPAAWAETCFTRALQLNPEAVLAHTELLRVRSELRRRDQPLWWAPPTHQYQRVSALPELERFQQLPRLARAALASVEELGRWDDPNLDERRRLARMHAQRYSEDALLLAPNYRAHSDYGTAVFVANMTLGALALRDGDTPKALAFLRRAGDAPASEGLIYGEHLVSDHHWHLAADLLKSGEREAVATFLDRVARINIPDRRELRQKAAAIRRGETPRL